jgi:hypothetical protein
MPDIGNSTTLRNNFHYDLTTAFKRMLLSN